MNARKSRTPGKICLTVTIDECAIIWRGLELLGRSISILDWNNCALHGRRPSFDELSALYRSMYSYANEMAGKTYDQVFREI